MPESPKISLAGESLRHIREGFESATDVWRHEGKKKTAEELLYRAGTTKLGGMALERYLRHLRAEGYATDPDPRLATSLGGIALLGPVGLAAGWDKAGRSLVAWQRLGARHVTPGGVAQYPQWGNPMVRLMTFDECPGDHGTNISWNMLGFNTPGVPTFIRNIYKQKEAGLSIPVIPQVTVNKEFYTPSKMPMIPDMVADTIRALKPIADIIDGVELGLSSRHTPGMRSAQDDPDFLYETWAHAKEAADGLPIGHKGDGDGGEPRYEIYCKTAEKVGLDWLSLINATGKPDILSKYGLENSGGSIAGADSEFQDMADAAVEYVYEAMGDKLDINAMAGVRTGDRALSLIRKGASAVSINSAIPNLGFGAFIQIENELSESIDHPLHELIGIDTKRGPKFKTD